MGTQTILFFSNLLICHSSWSLIAQDDSISSTDQSEAGISKFETGIGDVKSIIMEKYGRHYRLTGGSTLATKRNKPDAVAMDASNNATATVVSIENNTPSAIPTNISMTDTNVSNSNSSLENVTTTSLNSTGIDAPAGNNTNQTATSKSEITNATSGDSKETIVNLKPLKNETTNDTNLVVFGAPPEKPKLPADSENNYTAEGNLTTVTVDLAKDGSTAVIPGLDLSNSPIASVDLIVTNNSNTPKRSSASIIKPKKNIVFHITKPTMSINDFANKRKHVPHVEETMLKKRKNLPNKKKWKDTRGTKRSCHHHTKSKRKCI